MDQSVSGWTTSIGSEKLIKRLLAFTKAKKRFRPWANGRMPKGYLFDDVVEDAITIYLKRYLHDPEHTANEIELEEALQKIIVNRLKVLSEMRDNNLEFVNTIPTDIEPAGNHLSGFDEEAFENDARHALENDPALWQLFCDLYLHEYRREDLMHKYNVTIAEYDNMARRLRRRILPLLTKHNIHRYEQSNPKTRSSMVRA